MTDEKGTPDELDKAFERIERQTPHRITRAIRWLRGPQARKIRIPLALLLIGAGFLGFLPVLGFWLIPLGALIIAQDLPFLRRPIGRMTLWLEAKWREARERFRRRRGR